MKLSLETKLKKEVEKLVYDKFKKDRTDERVFIYDVQVCESGYCVYATVVCHKLFLVKVNFDTNFKLVENVLVFN